MIEKSSFPMYRPDSPTISQKRMSLMLTHEQVLMVASSLVLLHSFIHIKNPLVRFFLKPVILIILRMSDAELSLQTAIHNACINAALSFEEYEKSTPENEK
jgi:hypothetical protein